MKRLGVMEKDITERFLRSGGPGGQHVNKVSTCVYLKHIPTGMEVKCASQRYQSVNRFLARQILLDRIEKKREQEHLAEMEKKARLRREKRKRSGMAKEKMLAGKKERSKKKEMRRRVDLREY